MSLPGQKTTYRYDKPHWKHLARFKNPFSDRRLNRCDAMGEVTITAPEFTSLCPLTGQPDFATIVIVYLPDQWCLESKAIKLYLGRYRQHRGFHEECVARICNDIVTVVDPFMVRVRGEFTPRGGIPFWPEAIYRKPPPREVALTHKGRRVAALNK